MEPRLRLRRLRLGRDSNSGPLDQWTTFNLPSYLSKKIFMINCRTSLIVSGYKSGRVRPKAANIFVRRLQLVFNERELGGWRGRKNRGGWGQEKNSCI